eukprot:3393895-Rhodomonas_salina.1
MEGEKANGKTDRTGRHDHRRLKMFSDNQNGDAWLPTGRHLRPPRGRLEAAAPEPPLQQCGFVGQGIPEGGAQARR